MDVTDIPVLYLLKYSSKADGYSGVTKLLAERRGLGEGRLRDKGKEEKSCKSYTASSPGFKHDTKGSRLKP